MFMFVQVGKSALVSQFLWERFLTDYRPTVEEFNWVEYDVEEGSALMLQVSVPPFASSASYGKIL